MLSISTWTIFKVSNLKSSHLVISHLIVTFRNRLLLVGLKRDLHVTGVNCDIIWRRNRRLPKNPTSSGPLTDLPDYSFMDGRPTPLGVTLHMFNYTKSMSLNWKFLFIFPGIRCTSEDDWFNSVNLPKKLSKE